MPGQRLPVGAPTEILEAFREVWQKLDEIHGIRNADWRGKRIINAGDAVAEGDYVTLRQLNSGTTGLTSTIQRHTTLINSLMGTTRQAISITRLMDQGLGQLLWPVDSVFVGATDEDPAALLGFGTWELIAIGAGSPGGEMTITVQ